MPTPISVFTGFLGAGKTSIILALLPQLPRNYKVCLLKNEFGDVQVDSQLARQSSLTAVSEILNGCMCCVLVGQMKNALLEIQEKFQPDRILIETSGSAFPATLAFQIRELERETSGSIKLDAIVTVIDAENFIGYEDSSPTAKMQASYTDVILINKWENISERALDLVLDHLNTLNDLTPKIRCNGRNGVDPNLIFGLDSKLFTDASESVHLNGAHNDEVETVTIWRGPGHPPTCVDSACFHCHESLPTKAHYNADYALQLSSQLLTESLSNLSKESIWRVKGFVQLSDLGIQILNWAFGRHELVAFDSSADVLSGGDVLLTMMGERGEIRRFAKKFAAVLNAEVHAH